MTELSFLNRLEPRPRDNDLRRSLAAEIRDPLWFLARQWQMGEFEGEDTGSLAYVQYQGSTSRIPRWVKQGSEVGLEQAPLELQTLREPFAPDLGLQVELGQDFEDLLLRETNDATATEQVLAAFRALEAYAIEQLEDDDELDPVDPATKRFLMVAAGRAVNGYALYTLGLVLGPTDPLPQGLPTAPVLVGHVREALKKLVTRARKIFGEIGSADPVAWQKERLEYRLDVVAVDPAGKGNARLAAHPDSDGEYDWFSFDVVTKNPTAIEAPADAPKPVAFSTIPTRVQFDGMPAPRFWNFEENTLAVPDITAERDDLVKLMAADFMLVHSNDWYVIPYAQPVGTLAKTDHILVRDVFGKLTIVHRADDGASAPGTDRWTMFSTTDRTNETLSDYFILPPTSGPAMQLGSVLEDVRFARDEMANMAWAVERITASPIGEPRSGRERDAEIDARRQRAPAPSATEFPLRYDVESEVPANWVPLVPVRPNAPNPSIALQRARTVKETSSGPGTVPSLSNVLNPKPTAATYRIEEEEISRSGLRVERVVYRARWIDGTSHLWVQRRRRIGAGESQSGLHFDQARPNTP
jgi:hypothetical protein